MRRGLLILSIASITCFIAVSTLWVRSYEVDEVCWLVSSGGGYVGLMSMQQTLYVGAGRVPPGTKWMLKYDSMIAVSAGTWRVRLPFDVVAHADYWVLDLLLLFLASPIYWICRRKNYRGFPMTTENDLSGLN